MAQPLATPPADGRSAPAQAPVPAPAPALCAEAAVGALGKGMRVLHMLVRTVMVMVLV